MCDDGAGGVKTKHGGGVMTMIMKHSLTIIQ